MKTEIVDWRTIPRGAVWCIGQHTKAERAALEKRVRKGEMFKVRASWQGISQPKTVYVPTPGPNIHALTDELGLRATRYLNETTEDGKYWLPADLLGADGKTLVIYRRAGDGSYAVDGWEPWHDGMHGGRHTSYLAMLGWVRRAREIRAGKATHF